MYESYIKTINSVYVYYSIMGDLFYERNLKCLLTNWIVFDELGFVCTVQGRHRFLNRLLSSRHGRDDGRLCLSHHIMLRHVISCHIVLDCRLYVGIMYCVVLHSTVF